MGTELSVLYILGEPMRLRLATLLAMEGKVCVCRLAAAASEPQHKVLRHPGVMRSAELVESRQDGTWMYYTPAKHAAIKQEALNCYRRVRDEIRAFIDRFFGTTEH